MQFKVEIKGPADKIYNLMLGIPDKKSYEQWTALFNPTSSFEGNWEKGSKIKFIGVDEQGEPGGMLANIVENITHQFVSIQHVGILKGNEEITSGPEVEQWANGFENYTFKENDGVTTVIVDLDTTEDFIEYMKETYPLALNKLKQICEQL
jgi:hypothetical protein